MLDTTEKPTPRRAWAVNKQWLLGGAHLSCEGQQLGNLRVSLMAGINSQPFATEDDSVSVTVESDDTCRRTLGQDSQGQDSEGDDESDDGL